MGEAGEGKRIVTVDAETAKRATMVVDSDGARKFLCHRCNKRLRVAHVCGYLVSPCEACGAGNKICYVPAPLTRAEICDRIFAVD